MATTFKAIATVTVGSGGASNIEFTSIPGTYTDLLVSLSARTTESSGWQNIEMTVNNSATSYRSMSIFNQDGTVYSGAGATTWIQGNHADGDNATASTFSSSQTYIPNYASSNNKSFSIDFVTENNSTIIKQGFFSVRWANTAAITSIKFIPNGGGNFKQYTTAYLYGISKS